MLAGWGDLWVIAGNFDRSFVGGGAEQGVESIRTGPGTVRGAWPTT